MPVLIEHVREAVICEPIAPRIPDCSVDALINDAVVAVIPVFIIQDDDAIIPDAIVLSFVPTNKFSALEIDPITKLHKNGEVDVPPVLLVPHELVPINTVAELLRISLIVNPMLAI